MLDLILANSDNLTISTSHCDHPLVKEDKYHPSLNAIITTMKKLKTPNFPTNNSLRYDFRKANFPQLYEALCTIDLTVLENITNVDDVVNCFYSNLYDLFDNYVPKKPCGKSKYPVWFSPEIKANLKTKEYYRQKWLKSKIPYFLSEFKRMRTLIKFQINESYKSYLNSMERNIKSNPADLWKFLSQRRGTSRIPNTVFKDSCHSLSLLTL